MMAVRAVHVAVGNFLGGRRADVDDRRVEAQPLAGELVITVEHRLAIGDVGDAEDDLLTIFFRHQVAALGQVRWKAVDRLDADQPGVVFAERVDRLERPVGAFAELVDAQVPRGVLSMKLNPLASVAD